MGSALPFRTEFPLVLHGYFVEEVFAKRFWLVNASYRFPAWPGSRDVQLRLSFDMTGYGWLAKLVSIAILAGFSSVILVMSGGVIT